jgi:hypothetical protein
MSLEGDMEELRVQTSPGAEVSTTLTDAQGSKQGPRNGELHFLYSPVSANERAEQIKGKYE